MWSIALRQGEVVGFYKLLNVFRTNERKAWHINRKWLMRSSRWVSYLCPPVCCALSAGSWIPGSVHSGCNLLGSWSTAPPPTSAPSYTGLHPSPPTSSNPHRTLTSSQPMTAQPSPPSPIGRRSGKQSIGPSTFYKVWTESEGAEGGRKDVRGSAGCLGLDHRDQTDVPMYDWATPTPLTFPGRDKGRETVSVGVRT